MGRMLRGTKTSILKVKTVSTSKPRTDSGFTAPQMSFKAIKVAELRHQGHLRIIALSDFSPSLACAGQNFHFCPLILDDRKYKKS